MTDDEIYEYLGQVFEWSRAKAAKNALKHGVLFTEAATVFFDEEARYFLDGVNSESEERYTVIGHSVRLRAVFVVHVYRGERIRIISARPAMPRERRDYERTLGR